MISAKDTVATGWVSSMLSPGFFALAGQDVSMTLTQKMLRAVSLAGTGVGVIFALIALLSWTQAITAWGNPRPFSTALLWSFGAVVTFGFVAVFDWLRGRVDD